MSSSDRFVRSYWSTKYAAMAPKTAEQWAWVLKRFDLNFGKCFDALAPDAPILDVPCGIGSLVRYLLLRGFTRIDAVDASAEQIRVAEAGLREAGLAYDGQVTFSVADAFEHLRGGRRYAAIAAIDFLEHLSKPKIVEFLDLSASALDRGGVLITRVVNADNPTWGRAFFHDFTHETPFTPGSLRQCLAVVGLEPLEIAYEVVPDPGRERGVTGYARWAVRRAGLAVLGRFLGVPVAAFTEDLIAVARKP